MKKIFLVLAILLIGIKAHTATVWVNDARLLFQNNASIIMAINIRTFNAKDVNKNGIIENKYGEERGNFINAIYRLDQLALQGVNTIELLPITSVGKIKALGTAGSLYALNSFTEINPQLASDKSKLSPKQQAIRFIDEAHKRKLRVIVDLPSCASYDYYLNNQVLFLKKENLSPVIPGDWTDIRVLDAGNNNYLNNNLLQKYKQFIDLMYEIGADGIVASNASMKPYKFWQELIDYTREKSPQFLFIAQATDKDIPMPDKIPFTPYDKLLEAGFDGYFAGYYRFPDWRTAQDLYNHVKFNTELFSKYKQIKSSIGSFSTVDSVSPVLINGSQYPIMISWLNATLPVNSYFVDGFQSGDDYSYPWENKRAVKSYTDDDFYFIHKGKIDLFNFSRKPGGNDGNIMQNFVLANKFKYILNTTISNPNFVPLASNIDDVFSFARADKTNSVVVIGNMDFQNMQNVKVTVPHLTDKVSIVPIKIDEIPIIEKGRINTILAPGEIQVMLLKDFSIKK